MKKLMNFITAGADVKRFHTVNTINTETVGHHSHGVALMCFFFTDIPSNELLKAALFHDLAEQYTGDIPSPAKRELKISKEFSDLENSLLLANNVVMPELTTEETRILKLSDIAHGALFCLKEMRMGNTPMWDIFNRYIQYAEDMNLEGRELYVFKEIKGMI